MGGFCRVAPAPVVRDVILRDGTTLRLRAPARADGERLVAFVERLSPESRYFRFHGFVPWTRGSRPFVDPDWDRIRRPRRYGRGRRGEESWPSAPGRACATARAEAAFTVADAHPGARYRDTTPRAACGPRRSRGIEASSPRSCLPIAMLRVFEHVRFEVSRTLDGGEVEVTFPIAPPSLSRERRARDHIGVIASLGRSSPRDRRGLRRFRAPRVDRRPCLPQHPRGWFQR